MTILKLPPTFSTVNTLGQVRRLYQTTMIQKLSGFFSAGLFVIFAFVFVFFIRPSFVSGQPAGTQAMFSWVTLLVPAGLIFFAGIQILRSLLSSQYIVVYDNGLAFKNWRGLRQWPWESIQGLQAHIIRYSYMGVIPMGTNSTYTIWTDRGEHLSINQTIGQVQELAADIEKGTGPILLERSIMAFASNQPVNFGPISLSQQGVKFNNKMYDWSQVENISVERGYVQISKKGGGFFSGASVLAASVPNITVLLALLQHIGGSVATH